MPLPPDRPARVLIVEDDEDLRLNLRDWLACAEYDVDVAGDAVEAARLLNERRPDVVVTDLRLPGASGLDLLGLVKARDPGIEVILISGQATVEDAIAALREGRAFDFLLKPLRHLYDLNHAIERALARHAPPPASLPAAADDPLTPREREMLAAVAEGLDNRGIAARFGLSEKTVRNHLSNLYGKLGAASRTQALRRGRELGLLP